MRPKEMMELLRKIIRSRYVHLLLGMLVLYGASWIFTYTARFEKILHSLSWYCYADYMVEGMSSKRSMDKGSFYKERYRERLDSLTSGLFDWNDEDQAKEYFISKGYVYEVTDEGTRIRSYLLAPVVHKGTHTTESPQHVTFCYYMLGYKETPTFLEYLDKDNTSCLFVSAANKVIHTHPEIYIHRDSLIPILRSYFEFLWEKQPKKDEDFYIRTGCYPYKDIETYSLYLDLRSICEDIFIKRLYRNKREARNYFVNKGLEVFFPTLLAMGGRMAADQDLDLPSGQRYLRALFTGLSLKPNYTMSYLSCRYHHYDPSINKIMEGFKKWYGGSDPAEISLEQISQVAQETLEKLGGY